MRDYPTMRLNKDNFTVEREISPRMLAITLPVDGAEHGGIAVYVGVSAFAQFHQPGVPDQEWKRLIRLVAERLTLTDPLTKRERAAVRVALAAMLAGEEGAGDFQEAGPDGPYNFADGKRALSKMQEEPGDA